MRLIFLQPAVLLYGSELQFNNCLWDIGESGLLQWDPTFAGTLFIRQWWRMSGAAAACAALHSSRVMQTRSSSSHLGPMQHCQNGEQSQNHAKQVAHDLSSLCRCQRCTPHPPTEPVVKPGDDIFYTTSEKNILYFLPFQLCICCQRF